MESEAIRSRAICPKCGKPSLADAVRPAEKFRCAYCSTIFSMGPKASCDNTRPEPTVHAVGGENVLLSNLLKDPRSCPSCGGKDIRVSNEGPQFSVWPDKQCRKCGCRWSPQCSRRAALVAAGIGFPVALAFFATGAALMAWFLTDLLSGATPSKMRLVCSLCPFAIGIIGLNIGRYGLRVLKGQQGNAVIHDTGKPARS